MSETISQDVASLDDLYPLLDAVDFGPGWNKPEPAMWPEPRANFHAAHWPWRDARNALHAAGRLINTELAERRNLILVNPLEGNDYATLRTIITAYQMIRPGEKARAHRHSPHALRLILEGRGAYTIVNGEQIDMHPGDVLLTPGSHWHGHGNSGAVDCYWMDFLDVPLVQLLEPMFFEDHPDGFEDDAPKAETSPFVFPWPETEAALAAAPDDPEGCFGRVYEIPSGAIGSLKLTMHAYDKGYETAPFKTTANNVFAVVAGAGQTTVGDEAFAWTEGDVVAVPAWRRFSHQAESDAVLFRVSDERLQHALGYLREERG